MSKKAGRVARQAASVIEKHGWNQGSWSGKNGGVCVRGAFNVVTYGIVAMSPSPEELEFAEWMVELGVLSDNAAWEPCLASWNDDEGRTKEQVLAYLNKFAEEHDPQPVLP
jgi:hypothetical protein